MKMLKLASATLLLSASTSIYANTDFFVEDSLLDGSRFSVSVAAGKSRYSYDDMEVKSPYSEENGNHFKQSSTSAEVSLGYDLNEYFTVSANYQSLGEYQGTLAYDGTSSQFGRELAGNTQTVRISGFGLALSAQYPITDNLLPYAKVGVLGYVAKQTISYVQHTPELDGDYGVATVSQKDDKQALQYALGIGYKLNSSLTMFIEYQNSELDIVDFAQLPNVANYSFGISTRF